MKHRIELISSFEEWLNDKGKTENTIKTYINVITKLSLWLEDNKKNLTNLCREDIQNYMDELKLQGKTASTVDKVFASIRVFSQYRNMPQIVENIKRIQKEKNIYQTAPDCLDKDEQEHLLYEVENDKDLRNIAIVNMLLYTGIRISELCNLDFEDVEIYGQKGTVTVKGDKARKIPIPKDAVFHLQHYMSTCTEQSRPFFVSKQNKRLTIRTVQYMLEKYNTNPHKLRHTFCQDLIKKGLDLSIVAQLAGYNDLNMVKRYKHRCTTIA
ncbi:tyrosine-type recombinase/integrase [Bacillus sp. Marseille-P3661]|uniref:tyrosine-type recombinase/integrase n=1 Tax=Bacillus sp. Marseille-P3661 TaxID=1936234 RepID=UPI000C81A08B|nr:tyrosine-type recombinase/integrase [Bacillus sp. Marseille-P3661]